MSEQIERRYNLQPLSPNMIRKPPLSDFAAGAAGANIGSPAGLQTDGHNAALRARLEAVTEQARRDALMNLRQLQAGAALGQLNTAMSADRATVEQLAGQVGLDQVADAKTDPIATVANTFTGLNALGGAFGALERAFVPKDENGLYATKEIKDAEGRVTGYDYQQRKGAAGVLQKGFGYVRKVLDFAALDPHGRSRETRVAGLRQRLISGIQTPEEFQEYTDHMIDYKDRAIRAFRAGSADLARTFTDYGLNEVLIWRTVLGHEQPQ